uniref:Recombination activating protein 2 n=1 Tax=Ditylenchus dipsaci TaxID=166011 RepID=A0A915DKP8_9BILA
MMLNTLSLHSIEDDFLRDGYMLDNFSPDLCVDPGQRCVAFLVYGHHLGIVPFTSSSKTSTFTVTLCLSEVSMSA